MATVFNTIMLTMGFRHEEALAAAALSPGHLVELDSAGKVKKQAVEGADCERMWAVEDALQGNTIDTAYSTSDRVMLAIPNRGDEVFAYIKAGEDIAIGDDLIAAGDGTLIEKSSATSAGLVKGVLAEALEALDLTSSVAVATRLRVRIK